jgi:hypothetical protein
MVRDNYWAEAYKLWEIALEHEGVWDRLNVRIHDLKDPRLTTDFANSIRNTLPLFILLINAKLALRAAENNNKKEAKRHLEIMKRWRAGKTNSQTEQVTEALQIAVKPLNERIKLLSRHPVDECENNPANADKILLQFVDQAKKLLAILDILLPADHPTRNASHDQVALAALQCQVIYTNNTKNWERSLTLIDQFYPIAVSEFAKSQIKESRDTVETTWQLKQWR